MRKTGLVLLVLLAMLCAGYLVVTALVYAAQDSLLFIPRSATQAEALESWRRQFETPGAMLRGWVLPADEPSKRPLVFYYGGNGEDVSRTALALAEAGFPGTLVFVPYRGYGGDDGVPSEAALFQDALAIHDQASAALVHDGRRMVIGRSLGSGVAAYLASERDIDAAVLVTPFDSIVEVAAERFPWLPVAMLLRHRFESIELAPDLQIPALFVIAQRDEVIPLPRTLALLESWGGPVTRLDLTDAGHNDVTGDPRYWSEIARFVVAVDAQAVARD